MSQAAVGSAAEIRSSDRKEESDENVVGSVFGIRCCRIKRFINVKPEEMVEILEDFSSEQSERPLR